MLFKIYGATFLNLGEFFMLYLHAVQFPKQHIQFVGDVFGLFSVVW